MKNNLLTIFFFLGYFFINAQNECTPQSYVMKSNWLAAQINNDGTLFHNGEEGFFKIPYVDSNGPTTIRKAGLWVGGFDAGANLKIAAAAVNSENNESDFTPGPLNPENGLPYTEYPCFYFNKIWRVTGEEISTHLTDWSEDGKIDSLLWNIKYWPGNGNPYFIDTLPVTEQGWAPFYDKNDDGIYDPMYGDAPMVSYEDYPTFIPNEITWTVFHDETDHPVTGGLQTRLEIQQTAWAGDCVRRPEVEATLFVEYKFINRALEDIDSVFAGIWVDFNIGCNNDDYIGCMPSRDAFYGYNMDNLDGDENGNCDIDLQTYGEHPPAMSVKILPYFNPTSFDGFTYYSSDDNVEWGMSPPETDIEFYNYLTGSWRDGTPLTKGEDAYDPASTDITKFAFPGNPNNSNEWSMHSEQLDSKKLYAIGASELSTYLGYTNYGMRPGDSRKLLLAFTYNRDPTDDYIEIINRMENFTLKNIDLAYYSPNAVVGYCWDGNQGNTSEEENEAEPIYGIYPNPASEKITISLEEGNVEEVKIYDTAWKLIYSDKYNDEHFLEINLNSFQQGLYFILLKIDGQYIVKKQVIIN